MYVAAHGESSVNWLRAAEPRPPTRLKSLILCPRVGASIPSWMARSSRAAAHAVHAHDVAPGHVAPGHGAPGDVAPGDVAPGDVAPGHVAPGHVAPGNVAPGDVAPGAVRVRRGVQHLL